MSEFKPNSDTQYARLIREALDSDIRSSRLSREQIAVEMSDALGRNITRSQIDAYTSEAHPHRFPAEWIPVWVQVTGSHRLLELLAAQTGRYLADAEERDALAPWGDTDS